MVPLGITKQVLKQLPHSLETAKDYQTFARLMDVDVVIVGSVTDYSIYYPPRMGMAVRWYTANSCFHVIPPGYGLPWGTAEQEYIPDSLVFAELWWDLNNGSKPMLNSPVA